MDIIECSFAITGFALLAVESSISFATKKRRLILIQSIFILLPILWGIFFSIKTGQISIFPISFGTACLVLSGPWLVIATTLFICKIAKKIISGQKEKNVMPEISGISMA